MFCALLRSRYQVSVYRTNGPLVYKMAKPEVSYALEMDRLMTSKTWLLIACGTAFYATISSSWE